MFLFCILAAAFLALGRSGSAAAFGQVPARHDGNQPPQEPLIFHNLTRDEFFVKVLEHRGARNNKRVPDDPAPWEVRVGGEQRNNVFQQSVVYPLAVRCLHRFGGDYRVAHSSCGRTRNERRMVIVCKRVSGARPQRETTQMCEHGSMCQTAEVYNFLSNQVHMTYCAPIMEINERAKESDLVPSYEGRHAVPGSSSSPPRKLERPPKRPKLPPGSSAQVTDPYDSIDQIWTIEDSPTTGLTAQWEYHGHYSNGNGFGSRSLGMAHSFSCIGCPAGVLYAETVGFKSRAVGSIFM